MKKFLTFTLCVMLLIALPFSVYAEEETTESVIETTETVGETTESVIETTETVGETTETVGETTETSTETSIETSTGIVAPPPSETPEEGASNLLSVKFEEWVLPNLEEISVVITLIFTAFYNMRKHKLLNKSIGTMNNNTITIAENSANMMSQAVSNISNTANIVTAYDARIAAMLEAHQATVADRDRLEKELHELKAFLRSAAEANLEFSNELAELLNLANIPNFKKEEIGARHLAAVNSIKTAEEEALHTEEVIPHGEEA